MERKIATLFSVIAVLLSVTGCTSHQEESLAEIARAIAPKLDSLNGLPTATLDEYRCDALEEGCRERTRYYAASRLDAKAIVAAFAKAKGIPIARYEEVDFPACAWAAADGDRTGLWAQFVKPPSIQGDSARVELATVCMGRSGFEQVHEFSLHFDGREWEVVRRSLLSIT